MPDTPDFNKIAKRIVRDLPDVPGLNLVRAQLETSIFIELTNVRNARGAADIAKLDSAIPGTSIKSLDRGLRSLDR